MAKTLNSLLYALEDHIRTSNYHAEEFSKVQAKRDDAERRIVDAMVAAEVDCVFSGDHVYRLMGSRLDRIPCGYATEIKVPEKTPTPDVPAMIDDVELRIDRDADRDSREVEMPRVIPPFQCDCPECEDDAHARALVATDGETD